MDKAPGILKTLIGSENVELDIILDNGSQFKVGLEVNNGTSGQYYEGWY